MEQKRINVIDQLKKECKVFLKSCISIVMKDENFQDKLSEYFSKLNRPLTLEYRHLEIDNFESILKNISFDIDSIDSVKMKNNNKSINDSEIKKSIDDLKTYIETITGILENSLKSPNDINKEDDSVNLNKILESLKNYKKNIEGNTEQLLKIKEYLIISSVDEELQNTLKQYKDQINEPLSSLKYDLSIAEKYNENIQNIKKNKEIESIKNDKNNRDYHNIIKTLLLLKLKNLTISQENQYQRSISHRTRNPSSKSSVSNSFSNTSTRTISNDYSFSPNDNSGINALKQKIEFQNEIIKVFITKLKNDQIDHSKINDEKELNNKINTIVDDFFKEEIKDQKQSPDKSFFTTGINGLSSNLNPNFN